MAMRATMLDRNASLRGLLPATSRSSPTDSEIGAKPLSGFASTLQTAIQNVNTTLEQEDVATEAYERGETTDIATVALLQARSSVNFEATLQVRNKLLTAYNDIMNMQI